MATFKLADDFGYDLGAKIHDLTVGGANDFEVMLSNVAPVQDTLSVYTDITQIATGNGYTQFSGANSPHQLAAQSWAETGGSSGVWRWSTSDFVFTAAGGSIAQFRYPVIINNTAASNEAVGYLDYGSAVDVTVGNTFTLDVGANGWFELTIP